MTDDDKSGRHKSWADRIPLVTLLVAVFAAGGVFVEQKFIRASLDAATRQFERYAASSDARIEAMEKWRIAHEAAAAAREAEREKDREKERKRR